MAKKHKCDECRAVALPQPRPPASDVVHEPGRVVGWDGFYWKHPTRHLVTRGMIIVDEGSRHFVSIALETKATHRDLSNDKWEECFEAYSIHWAMH